nr:hypothetical protein [Aromatoleum diolicum]
MICAVIAVSVLAPVIAGAAGALAPATPAAAAPSVAVQTQPEKTEALPSVADVEYVFGLLDLDTDGRIAKEEAKASAPLVKYFGDIDTDSDGTISLSEWSAYFRYSEPRAGA